MMQCYHLLTMLVLPNPGLDLLPALCQILPFLSACQGSVPMQRSAALHALMSAAPRVHDSDVHVHRCCPPAPYIT